MPWEDSSREDHGDRDPAHGRIRQCAVGPGAHRCRRDRPWRDLLRRRRRRGPYSRHARRPPARPRSAAHRGDPPRHAQSADGAILDRRRISRGLRDRHRAVGSVRQGLPPAGAPDARRALPRQAAHLQYLRRLPICPLHQHQAGLQLESRRVRRPLRGSRRLHEPRRRARRKPARERHHGDEDLAVRSGGAGEPGPVHHAPSR